MAMTTNAAMSTWTYVPNSRQQIGSHLYLKETIIYLDAVLRSLSDNIKYVHLYCDVLSIKDAPEAGHVDLSLASICHGSLRYIHIYARKFLDNEVRTLDLNGIHNLKIRIFFGSTSSDLDLAWKDIRLPLAHSTATEPAEDEDQMRVRAERTSVIGKELRILPESFEMPDLFSVPYTETDPPVSPPSASREFQSGPTELLQLLGSLFDHASGLLLKNTHGEDVDEKAECKSIYRFIMACSSISTRAAHLFSCSQKLLGRLELPALYPDVEGVSTALRLTVPSLTLTQYKTEFDTKLKAAEMRAADIDRLAAAQQEGKVVEIILEAISKSIESFSKSTAIDEADVRTALQNVLSANKASQEASGDVELAKVHLEAGIKKYGDDQKAKFKQAIVFAVGEFAFACIVGYFTMGAGSVLATGNIAEISKMMDKGKELVSNGQKLWSLIKQLAKVMVKLGPKMYASFKTDTAIEKATTKVKSDYQQVAIDAQNLGARSTILPSIATEPFDYVGLMADWEEFKETIDLVFLEFKAMLKNDWVDGLDEYRTSLRKMCIRGQAVLDARRVAQEEISRYVRNLADANARMARGHQIMDIQYKFQGADKGIPNLAKYCMSLKAGELVAAKRDLFVLFHTCCNAAMYLCAASVYPNFGKQRVAADMTLTEFHASLSELLSWKNDMRGEMGPAGDSRILINTTASNAAFGPDWKAALQAERVIRLALPYDQKNLKNSFHPRVKNFNITMKGLAPRPDSEQQELQYRVVFGPQCKDLDNRGRVLQYYMKPRITTARTVGGKGRELWKDQDEEFALPTPLASISIGLDEEQAQSFDLSSVTEIEVVMDCAVHPVS